MAKIELTNGYYIDVDDLNNTLKQRYDGKTKDGEIRGAERVIGYYGKIENAIMAYLEHNQNDLLGDAGISIDEYVKQIDKINKESVRAIKRLIEGDE